MSFIGLIDISSSITTVFQHLQTEVMSFKLVRYARACCKDQVLVDGGKLLSSKFLSQVIGKPKAKLLSRDKTIL